ncbi:MAG TPA: hypothetical protein PK074_08705 [Spirochaetales bacterium]|jgi:hypothetical protein|nr:hypothetical protein [Spirochaetales bacterium]
MLEEEARKREYAGINQYSRGVQLVAQGSTGKSRDHTYSHDDIGSSGATTFLRHFAVASIFLWNNMASPSVFMLQTYFFLACR